MRYVDRTGIVKSKVPEEAKYQGGTQNDELNEDQQ
jgi:hypothetical protein